jgi:hypothetical protein
MIINFNIKFEDNFFYEYEPEPKSPDELVMLILLEAAGKKVTMNKYHARDIAQCARALILKGFIHGTVMDRFECSWSRLTKKGYVYLKTINPEIFY